MLVTMSITVRGKILPTGVNELPLFEPRGVLVQGGYWEAREKGQWTDIPDIYGPGGEPKGQDKAQNGTMHCYVVG